MNKNFQQLMTRLKKLHQEFQHRDEVQKIIKEMLSPRSR
jgi:hypothetical protein